MNRALKWKLIVGFVLVFVAGGMTGAFLGASHARHLFFAQPHRGMISQRMRDHYRAKLNLTPEQVAKISPIIDKAAAQLEEIRGTTGRRVHETLHGSAPRNGGATSARNNALSCKRWKPGISGDAASGSGAARIHAGPEPEELLRNNRDVLAPRPAIFSRDLAQL